MADPAGEADRGALRLDFDRRLMLRFRGSVITSDGGLLAYRELDDALALTASGGERLAEARTGRNRRHLLVGLLRQSVFGRLAGYEDVNDAERLCRDPAMSAFRANGARCDPGQPVPGEFHGRGARQPAAQLPAAIARADRRRPQYRRALDPLVGDDHTLLVDVFYLRLRHDRDAQLFEPPGGLFG
jgi:hypothetical protein